ncbi:MAG: hypothetical protein ABEJ87_00160 [Candidatus Nanohalobium sp.]
MIVGNYYINNALIGVVLVAAVGGLGYSTGVFNSVMPGGSGEVSSPGRNLSISLENSDLRAGSTATVTVRDSNGDTVSEAAVYVKGSQVGVTSERGKIRFSVPNSSQVTVKASIDGANVTRTLQVSGSSGSQRGNSNTGKGSENSTGSGSDSKTGNDSQGSGDTGSQTTQASIDIRSPGSTVYSKDLTFEVAVSGGSHFEVSVDGSPVYSGSFSGDKVLSHNFSVSSYGSHRFNVSLFNDEGLLNSSVKQLNVEAGGSGGNQSKADIGIRNPGDSQVLTGSDVVFKMIFDTGTSDLEYRLLVDGQEKASGGLPSGFSNVSKSLTFGPGDHSYTVKVVDSGAETVSEKSGSFSVETNDAVIFRKPEYTFYTGEVPLKLDLKKDLADSYRVMVDGEKAYSGQLSGDKTIEKTLDLSTGNHTLRGLLLSDGDVIVNRSKEVGVERRDVFALHHPNDTVIDDYQTYFYFEVDNSILQASSYDILLDGKVVHSGKISGDGNIRVGKHQSLELNVPDAGDHSWKVRTSGTYTNTSEVANFTTTRSEPSRINLDLWKPSQGATVSGQVRFSWNVSAPSDQEYDVYWITNASAQQGPSYMSGSGGMSTYSELFDYNGSATYSWRVNITNKTTGNVITSAGRSLNYE